MIGTMIQTKVKHLEVKVDLWLLLQKINMFLKKILRLLFTCLRARVRQRSAEVFC